MGVPTRPTTPGGLATRQIVRNSAAGDAVRVVGLHKSFGDRPVLWDLDLTVGWGESLVLFGANGVGKTTLLRILSTQVRSDAGTASVAGYDLRRQPAAIRRSLGVVGHRHFLYEDLTCRENLLFYGRLFNVSPLQQRVQAVLRRVGLESRGDQRVRTLSHGMQQRLSVARAILHWPSLLLLDEPEAGLDREAVVMLGSLLSEWTDSGRSVVMTTHNVELGLAWADRVALLTRGKIDFLEWMGERDVAGFRQMLATCLEAPR